MKHAMARRLGFTLVEMIISVFVASLICIVLAMILELSYRTWLRSSSQMKAYPPAYLALNRVVGDLRNAVYVRTTDIGNATEFWDVGEVYAIGDYVLDKGVHYRCLKSNTGTLANEPIKGTTDWTIPPSWIAMYNAQPAKQTNGTALVLNMKAGGIDRNITPNDLPLAVDLSVVKIYYLSDTTGTTTKLGTNLWCKRYSQNGMTGSATELDKKIVAENVKSVSFYVPKYANNSKVYSIYSMAIAVEGKEKTKLFTSKFASESFNRNQQPQVLPTVPTSVIPTY